jgi:hypothetical protein
MRDVKPMEQAALWSRRHAWNLALGVAALASPFFAYWAFNAFDAVELWLLSVAAMGLLGVFFFAPYASLRGHKGEGVIATWLGLWFGPFALVMLIPWALGLNDRYDAETRSR